MAGNPNTVVVFGSSPDSYYVGHGHRHFVGNMSPSFMNHAKNDLNITMSHWISVSRNGDTWIDCNVATAKFQFSADIAQDIRDHLNGANGKAADEFISFPDTQEHAYFVLGKKAGIWNAVLPNHFIQRLMNMQRAVPDFDATLTGMIFGQGTTSIITFKGGFDASFDEAYINPPDHPLFKVLREFSEPGCCIERESTLCLYDSQFFFLKFKKASERTVHTRWNLPIAIAAKLAELKELAQAPEEKMALMQQDQMWMNVAQTRRMGQIQAADMVNNMVLQNSLGSSFAPRTVRII
ncbi:hypothetical protein FB451DRAFT_1494328 [Mycena latifolia]|nr:hypothetical protein FB451DRAFT_1494328 [Mycena latifolia]